MRQGRRLFYPLTNSISMYHSYLSNEGKMTLNEWMTVTWTTMWIQGPPCFQYRIPAHAEAAVCRWAVQGVGHGWRLFLYGWPGQTDLVFCKVHGKDSRQSINSGTPFTTLNYISFGAQYNSSICVPVNFSNWFDSINPALLLSTQHFVSLTWKRVSPINKSIMNAGYSEATGKVSLLIE